MTTHTPLRCANSVMSAAPTGGARVVLLNTGNYPSFSNYLNETWIFTGTDWTNLSSSTINSSPLPLRANACMSYDGTNVMLFGGQGGSSSAGSLNDTWLWNGTTWTKATPTNAPFARWSAEAAYIGSNTVVMFGGCNVLYDLLETWTWNGSTQAWTQVAVANGAGPAARTGHMFAGDGSSKAVLFGGQGTNSQFNDTWTYTTAAGWTQVSPATSPSVRSNGCMVYDSVNSIWVMFGGSNEYTYDTATWTFNGTTWTKAVAGGTSATPCGRIGAQMSFDVTSGKTILFGGIGANANYPLNDTWSFNGATSTWTQL
jgi:hypothetical protein